MKNPLQRKEDKAILRKQATRERKQQEKRENQN